MENADTKANIIKAMKALSKDKPFDKITIGDITATAGISRQTFYYHFNSIFEAYKWSIANYTKKSYDVVRMSEIPSLLEFALSWAHALEKQKQLTIAILNSSYASEFRRYYTAKNNEISIQFVRGIMGRDAPREVLEMTALFLSHAYTGLVVDWIEKDMEAPISTIKDTITLLMGSVLKPEIYQNVVGNWNA